MNNLNDGIIAVLQRVGDAFPIIIFTFGILNRRYKLVKRAIEWVTDKEAELRQQETPHTNGNGNGSTSAALQLAALTAKAHDSDIDDIRRSINTLKRRQKRDYNFLIQQQQTHAAATSDNFAQVFEKLNQLQRMIEEKGGA